MDLKPKDPTSFLSKMMKVRPLARQRGVSERRLRTYLQELNADLDGLLLFPPYVNVELLEAAEAHGPAADLARRPRRRPASSWVYFALADEVRRVKIGMSVSPRDRISTINADSPVAVRLVGTMPGTAENESALHRRFRHLHVKGEWFEYRDELADYIAKAEPWTS